MQKGLKVLAVGLVAAFFSSTALAGQFGGIKFAKVLNAGDKKQGCGRDSNGGITCVKESWCVPFTNLCSWEIVSSEGGKKKALTKPGKEKGAFEIVQIDGKKPKKSAEQLRLEQDARDLGITPQELKKIEDEDNEFARLLREIQVKRAEEEKRRKKEKENKGKKHGGGGSSDGAGIPSGGGGGGGSSGNGSSGGGSSGGGSSGSSSSGGGSSGSGSSGGGSSGSGSKKRSYYQACYNGKCNYGDSESQACSGPASDRLRFSYEDSVCLGTDGKNKWLWGVSKVEWEVEKESGCKDGINRVDTAKGTFSVICTVKHGNTDFGGSSVGSLGGSDGNSSSLNSTGGKGSNSSSSSSAGGKGSGSSSSSSFGGSGGGSSLSNDGDASSGSGGGTGGGNGKGKGDKAGDKDGDKTVDNDWEGDGNDKDKKHKKDKKDKKNDKDKDDDDDEGDGEDKEDKDDEDLSMIEKLILGVIEAIEKVKESISEKLDGVKAEIKCLRAGGVGGVAERGDDADGAQTPDCGGKGGGDKGDDNGDGQGGGSGEDGGDGGLGDSPDEPDWGSFDAEDGNGDGGFHGAGVFGSGGRCPQDIDIPIEIQGFSSSVRIQYKPFCDAASMMRPVIIMAGYIIAAFMIYSTLKRVQ